MWFGEDCQSQFLVLAWQLWHLILDYSDRSKEWAHDPCKANQNMIPCDFIIWCWKSFLFPLRSLVEKLETWMHPWPWHHYTANPHSMKVMSGKGVNETNDQRETRPSNGDREKLREHWQSFECLLALGSTSIYWISSEFFYFFRSV